MREKFKVWDRENREWLDYKKRLVGYKGNFDPKNDHLLLHYVEMWVYESKDGLGFQELQFCIDSPYFDVIQYIGLQDKNKNDVYNGDIVLIKKYKNHFASIYEQDYPFPIKIEIFYSAGYYCGKVIEPKGFECDFVDMTDLLFHSNDRICGVVIGNICEQEN